MSRRWTVAALASVTTVGALALVAIFNTPVGTSSPTDVNPSATGPQAGTVAASLEDVMPAHPVTAITTPAGSTWWNFIVRMAPMAALADVDIAQSGVPTVGYGYSTSAVKTADVAATLPTYAAAYVQTTSVENADKFIAWLKIQPGADHRTAHRSGLTVIIGPEWADRTEFILDTKSTTAALTAKARTPSTTATWSWDLGRWRTTTQERAKTPQAGKSVDASLDALGITPMTSVTVNATSPNGPWTGTAKNYNQAAVNINALSVAVQSSDKIIAEHSPTKATRFQVLQTGLGVMDRKGGVTVFEGGVAATSFGQRAPKNLMAGSTSSVGVQIDPHKITDYALGYTTENPGPAALNFQIDANGKAVLAPIFATK